MREDNLLALRRTPFLVPPQGKPKTFMIVPNLIRGLVLSAPDQIWVADITYVHLARAFVYLAVILDAFSRKAVGWALRQSLDASVAIAALDQALETRSPPKGSQIQLPSPPLSFPRRREPNFKRDGVWLAGFPPSRE